jgi:hypothetical protein
METQTMTQQQIRKEGIEILGQYMGMIRFLQQSETGYGDYKRAREVTWKSRFGTIGC